MDPIAPRPSAGRAGGWITGPSPRPSPALRLFCLPFAGGVSLLVGQSNYEQETTDDILRTPSVETAMLRSGRLVPASPSAGPDTSSAGPMALSDFDGDGDLDLFVGGRVIAGGYPQSPSSRFLRNNGRGQFELALFVRVFLLRGGGE